MKRTPKEYYKILERVNSSEKFIVIHSNDPSFPLYDELRQEGFIDTGKNAHWKSGESIDDARKIIYNCSPTIKGIQLQYQIRDTLFPWKFFTFLGGVILSAVVSTLMYSGNRIIYTLFVESFLNNR